MYVLYAVRSRQREALRRSNELPDLTTLRPCDLATLATLRHSLAEQGQNGGGLEEKSNVAYLPCYREADREKSVILQREESRK